MLTITARFLHGTIRAGSPDDTTMAGGPPVGEWPPSPARLLSALVAADGTRDRCRVTDGTELAVIEALGPPRIHADELEEVAETKLCPRFVVRDEKADAMSQNYPARSSAEVRPGVRMSPRNPLVSYIWEEDLDETVVSSLRLRAARVGYLGCADSPVHLSVSTEPPQEGLVEWQPSAEHGVTLPVPYAGFVGALDDAFDAWTSGQPTRRSWIPTRRERYGTAQPKGDETDQPTTLWLEFDRPVPGRRALLVSETLRKALLDLCDRHEANDAGPSGHRAPWQLHGHAVPASVASPYQLARYLPLLNVGHPHSDGAIHGAAVWLPPATDPEVIELVRSVVFGHLRRLRSPGLDVALTLRSDVPGRSSTRPARWSQPARRWFSATPVVAERGRRRGPNLDDVRTWFTNAGHPEPARAHISPVPTGPGVPRLQSGEVHRPGRDRHPYYWLDVEFDTAVDGPICVGRGRSFGIGLFAPGDVTRSTRTEDRPRSEPRP